MVDVLAGIRSVMNSFHNRPAKRRRLNEINEEEEEEKRNDSDDDGIEHINENSNNRMNPLLHSDSIDLTVPSLASQLYDDLDSHSVANNRNNNNNANGSIVDLTEESSENEQNYEEKQEQELKENDEMNNSEVQILELSDNENDNDEIQILNKSINVNVEKKKQKNEDVMITKIRKSKELQQREIRNVRLQKIESWLGDDESLTNEVRKLLLLCPICQESLIDRNPSSTECGHLFCGQCLFSALNRVSQCPLCQKPMSILNTHKVYL